VGWDKLNFIGWKMSEKIVKQDIFLVLGNCRATGIFYPFGFLLCGF